MEDLMRGIKDDSFAYESMGRGTVNKRQVGGDHYMNMGVQPWKAMESWMTDEQLNDLWTEITRTARPGARVIFRTAAEPTLLPGRVSDEILARWRYREADSARFTREDRSSIYGGFHLYELES